ncbi:MAG: cell division protein FtsA [bacterium]|nr:cell division protein FtsA [bacterium]
MRKIYTGIDIGSFGIKIIVSEYINNKFHVLASTNIRSKGIKNGLVIDFESASLSLQKAKQSIEEQLGTKIDQAIVGLPSNQIGFDIVSGEIALDPNKMIDSDEISAVFQDAVLGSVKENMELVTILPISFQIDEEEGVKDPKGLMGSKLNLKAVITMIPKNILNEITALFKENDIEMVDIGFPILGDYFEVRNKEMDHEVVAIINIGYDTTDVAIFNKGIMIKNEKIEAGSSLIDIDIAKRYYLKRSTARHIKETFAVSNTRYADVNDIIEIMDKDENARSINQLELSELVEQRIQELLKLAKKQISILTNREISYIIITGGISELAGFQYVVENVFDRRASTLNIGTLGIRNNMYSSALGLLKYFHYKLELRGKSYSMFSEKQAENLMSTKKKMTDPNEGIISKVFGYFS